MRVPEYTVLRQEIGRLLESEHSVSRQAVEQERVRAYWEVGQRLHQVLPAPKGRGYGRHILGRLAVDLDIRERHELFRLSLMQLIHHGGFREKLMYGGGIWRIG